MSQTLEANEVGAANARLAGKYLTFMLGEESYGIPVGKVREIIRMADITAVPQMPEYISGVINLRGKIIPVLDLRLRFGLKTKATDVRTCIIVAQITLSSGESVLLGMIVDAVEEVVFIDADSIEEVPHFGTSRIDHGYLLSMAKVKGKVKTLLDIDKVLSADALEEIAA